MHVFKCTYVCIVVGFSLLKKLVFTSTNRFNWKGTDDQYSDPSILILTQNSDVLHKSIHLYLKQQWHKNIPSYVRRP